MNEFLIYLYQKCLNRIQTMGEIGVYLRHYSRVMFIQKFYGFNNYRSELFDERFVTIKLDYMRKPLILLFICLLISTIILIIEKLLKYMVRVEKSAHFFLAEYTIYKFSESLIKEQVEYKDHGGTC